jgi:hypothetical protein
VCACVFEFVCQKLCSHFAIVASATIYIDLENVYNNQEVDITYFESSKNGVTLHKGFTFGMEGHYLGVRNNCFKSWLLPPNKVLLSMPSMSHTYMNEWEQLDKEEECDHVVEARAVDCIAITRDPKRKLRYLLLVFPENYVLSNHIYSPGSDETGLISANVQKINSFFFHISNQK